MERKLIIPPGIDTTKMVIAPGVRVGDLLYVSGNAGLKDGKLVGADVESQARQTMVNLGEVLKAAGLGWDRVAKVNCFLVYPERDFATWNKVWKEFFPKDPPARTTVGASIALAGALIEVELVAAF